MVTSECVRRIVAGHAVETGSSIVRRTMAALRGPGTDATSFGTRIGVGMVNEIAASGTSSIAGNHDSASCCCWHCASSCTTFASSGSLKSATGGSLNARCPFSPICLLSFSA